MTLDKKVLPCKDEVRLCERKGQLYNLPLEESISA